MLNLETSSISKLSNNSDATATNLLAKGTTHADETTSSTTAESASINNAENARCASKIPTRRVKKLNKLVIEKLLSQMTTVIMQVQPQ